MTGAKGSKDGATRLMGTAVHSGLGFWGSLWPNVTLGCADGMAADLPGMESCTGHTGFL